LIHRKEIIPMLKIAFTYRPDRYARLNSNLLAKSARAAQCVRQSGALARYCLLAVVLLLAVVTAQAQWVNHQPAASVIGKPSFTSSGFQVNDVSISFSVGVAVDPTTGKVFAADSNIVRVTRYTSMAAMMNGGAAEAVLGQPDFMANGVALTQNGQNQPNGIFVDGAGRLWVADRGNNRVLRYDNASTKANGANADGVLGQPDFMTNTPGVTASLMEGPIGVFADAGGRLWVSDRGNARVLRFDNAAAKANGAAADGVLGQPDFMTKTGGTSATKMVLSEQPFVDTAGRLWVADSLNNRVLRFDNAAAKANGAAADGVLGQPNLMSGGGGTTQNTMSIPGGVCGDPEGRIYVMDTGNSRVLIFNNAAAKANGANADNVLGQPNFTSGAANNGGLSATSLRFSIQGCFDPVTNSLYVADLSNGRVMRFAIPRPAISKNFSPTTIFAGGASTVTLTLNNSNNSPLTNASFTDTLANMSAAGGAVGGSCSGIAPGSLSAGATGLSFSGITIPANGSCTVTFDVTSSTPGAHPNTASGVATAENATAGSPSNTATLTVMSCPTITLSTLSNATSGSSYAGSVAASPAGSYTYSVLAGSLPPGFALNSATGALTGLTTATGTYNFTLKALDTNNCSGTQSYTLVVSCPATTLGALINAAAGVSYAGSVAASPAGSYTYSLVLGSLPSGLLLNPSTGALTGLSNVPGTYNFTIQAQVGGGCSGTQSYTMLVNCPTITLSALPTPSLNMAYSQSVTASPSGSYSFAVTAGALPTGLSLNSATGVVSGTPTASGAYSFMITATGFGACTGSSLYSGTIAGIGCMATGVTLAALPPGTVGMPYNNYPTALPVAMYTYSLTAGSLPPGLILYPSIGLISGYPTTAGTYNFTILATDGNTCVGMRSYTVVIN
jgi:sugar lactone lactonase YvrE